MTQAQVTSCSGNALALLWYVISALHWWVDIHRASCSILSEGDGNFTGTGLVQDTFLVGMHIVPFLFMGLVLNSWSTRPAAHSRNVSVSYRQMGPCQPQPACFRESNLIPNPTTASRSFCLTQLAVPVRLQLDFTEQLSGRQLWFASKKPEIPSSLLSPSSSIFLPQISPFVPAALPFTINHTTTRHVLNSCCGTVPGGQPALSEVLFSPFGNLWNCRTELNCR